jgi:hypothetical protein
MITQMFITVLRSIGTPASITGVSKHTREDVLFNDSEKPFRRSSLYLLVRVALQSHFPRSPQSTFSNVQAVNQYKAFMVFHMTSVLQALQHHGLEDTTKHLLIAKITRRLLKLGDGFKPLSSKIQAIVLSVSQSLQDAWRQTQEGAHLDIPDMSTVTYKAADAVFTFVSLPGWINELAGKGSILPNPAIEPQETLPSFRPDSIPSTPEKRSECFHTVLLAIEEWVEDHLHTWSSLRLLQSDTCHQLYGLMTGYFECASYLYKGNPERLSAMLLVLLELWIACDQPAIANSPRALLEEYDHGIPTEIFSALVLPSGSQLRRLGRSRDYLVDRKRRATEVSKIHHSFGKQDSYGVRYAKQSPKHQEILRIVDLATQTRRDNKISELQDKQAHFDRL